jgi:hypothetical protein
MRANHFSKECTSMTVKLETYTSSLFGAFSLVNTPYHSNLLTVNRDGHGSLSVGLWEVFYMLTTLLHSLVLFQSNADEYEEMPIAEFGKAMLRGMGWKDGTAIGKSNKGMLAPVEFIPRLGKLGLGAAPKPKEKPTKRRPGETKKKVVQGPYIGADGRVKHMRLIGEDIPEQPIQGYTAGNCARVLSGPHMGLCGKIVSADEDKGRVGLRLAINAQVSVCVYTLNCVPSRPIHCNEHLESYAVKCISHNSREYIW